MARFAHRAQWSAGFLFVLIAAAGCGHPSKSLPASYPATVRSWHHGTLDSVEFVERFALSDYQTVLVEPVETQGVPLPPAKDNTYKPVTDALAKATTLVSTGVRQGVKGAVAVDSAPSRSSTGAGKELLVRSTVLIMDPGSQAARYWVGFGAGKAETRIKGEIVDGSSGRTLARFEDSAETSGGLFGGGYALLEGHLTDLGSHIGTLVTAFGAPK